MRRQDVMVLVLALATIVVGPFAAIPGVILGRRLQNPTTLGQLAYGLCWFVSVLYSLVFVVGALAGLAFPLWERFLR